MWVWGRSYLEGSPHVSSRIGKPVMVGERTNLAHAASWAWRWGWMDIRQLVFRAEHPLSSPKGGELYVAGFRGLPTLREQQGTSRKFRRRTITPISSLVP